MTTSIVSITDQTTVRDLVGRFPQTRKVFEEHGIDYCCGGSQSLAEAARAVGMELTALTTAVEEAMHTPPSNAETAERDWYGVPLPELVDHIIHIHHAYTKSALLRIRKLLRKVLRAHGVRHGAMLSRVQTPFLALERDLTQHLMKEETLLFPYIVAAAACREKGDDEPGACFGAVQNPIRQMEHEHDAAGELLRRIRDVTDGYHLPEDACPTFAALYDELRQLEADLHQHIHLENNVLFSRTIELEHHGTG